MREIYKNVAPLIYCIDNALKSEDIDKTEKKVLTEIAEILMKYMPNEKVKKVIDGVWIVLTNSKLCYCSNCRTIGNKTWDYCSKCGATMKGVICE